jgi:hypothetical protein
VPSLIGLRDELESFVTGQDFRKAFFLLLSDIDPVHRARVHAGDELFCFDLFCDRPGLNEIDGVLESANKNERLSSFLAKSQNLASISSGQL